MDKRHPKRRKWGDNPYTLSIENGKFYVSFKDGLKIEQHIEITETLFQTFDEFELDDKHLLNEDERHSSEQGLTEDCIQSNISVEDIVIRKYEVTQLNKAIDTLPSTQQRRLKKHHYDEKTLKKIAEEENCKYQPVQRSVYRAEEKIKIILKNRGVF